ncbi:group 1 truncated hemoglobin [Rhodococcus sp. G-MC3]|uniref:group I truncated hemoglobin n=1 Tax=Rhodococcus sp. G-MC3 TaxID=3046209 RepID=UPI0024B8D43B|nr:group 1 truncated hemoglobin [Rhodococcus sp. G-MC3]MDJ0396483.1 group 1 truncated hemoglobin [Rhodococcus sp. G-MC3]
MTTTVPDTRRLAPEADPSTAAQVNQDASLYERLGGCYGIAGAVDVLVDRLFANVKVNANEKVHEHHGNAANAPGYKFLVTAWSIEVTGGPKCYIGHDMHEAHEHLKIDKAGFDAVYLEIKSTLFYLGVPDAEVDEFMAIIDEYRSQVVQA